VPRPFLRTSFFQFCFKRERPLLEIRKGFFEEKKGQYAIFTLSYWQVATTEGKNIGGLTKLCESSG
jgi:hypothetical protein